MNKRLDLQLWTSVSRYQSRILFLWMTAQDLTGRVFLNNYYKCGKRQCSYNLYGLVSILPRFKSHRSSMGCLFAQLFVQNTLPLFWISRFPCDFLRRYGKTHSLLKYGISVYFVINWVIAPISSWANLGRKDQEADTQTTKCCLTMYIKLILYIYFSRSNLSIMEGPIKIVR